MVRKKNTSSKQGRIDAKAASIIAKDYYEEITGKGEYTLSLEEVELSEDEKYWYITISIHTPTASPLFVSQGFHEKIAYKKFKINAETGKVYSMKMIQYPLAPIK